MTVAALDLEFEFLASANWDEQMPERLRWLRENDPVHWSGKDQLWVVTSYAGVEYVSKHQEFFTSAQGVRPDSNDKLGLLDEAEPRHSRLRKLINKGFTPRMAGKLEQPFREIVAEAIDQVAAAGECDFVDDIAVPVPLLLIAELIGIPRQDREQFHHWSDTMIAADGNRQDLECMAAAHRAFGEYSAYVSEIIADRRKSPRDDLISVLAGANQGSGIGGVGAEGLDIADAELVMLLVLLMVAGNETTRNGISGGMQLLIEHPEQRQKLIDDPSLIPSAVEEMVRLVSPVQSFGRTATRDLVLGGHEIAKGQKLLLVYPCANRDPQVYDQPDAFDVDRNPHHLGFGIGSHFCLGANLARMEMRVAFEELLRRLPDMRYANGGPEFAPSALVRTCLHMRVRFSPEA